MQKTLTLTASEPSEEQELDAALHAMDFVSVISHMLTDLRETRKYGTDAQEAEYAEKMRKQLWQMIQDYNLERFFE